MHIRKKELSFSESKSGLLYSDELGSAGLLHRILWLAVYHLNNISNRILLCKNPILVELYLTRAC